MSKLEGWRRVAIALNSAIFLFTFFGRYDHVTQVYAMYPTFLADVMIRLYNTFLDILDFLGLGIGFDNRFAESLLTAIANVAVTGIVTLLAFTTAKWVKEGFKRQD